MTDTTVEPDTADAGVKKLLTIEIRAKCGSVDVDVDQLPIEVYEYALKVGLEAIINKVGMSKIATGITKLTGKEAETAKAKVVEQAQKNVAALYDGSIKGMRSATKRAGVVNTEAMRLAKAMVKELLRSNGYKISAFDAKELTAMAKEVLAANPDIYKKAEANLAERSATPVKGFDLKKMLGTKADDESFKAKPKVPPKPKAKGEGKPLSAKQAGMVAPRTKPTEGHKPTAH
jgi:hypothetical protein